MSASDFDPGPGWREVELPSEQPILQKRIVLMDGRAAQRIWVEDES